MKGNYGYSEFGSQGTKSKQEKKKKTEIDIKNNEHAKLPKTI